MLLLRMAIPMAQCPNACSMHAENFRLLNIGLNVVGREVCVLFRGELQVINPSNQWLPL